MSGTELKIRVFGDPVLTRKARPVKKVTEEHRRILSEMSRLMYAVSGVGLAAPQVGISESLVVIDAGSGLYKLINPRIIRKQGVQSMEEGCLSVPGIGIRVRRAKKVVVEAIDEAGQPVSIEAEDLLACVFQHELDHLNGRLIVDYASLLEKLKIRNKLALLKKQVAGEGVSKAKTKSKAL